MSCQTCIFSVLNNPVVTYQNQQRIWNSSRVSSSEYVMNKSSLSAIDPTLKSVNWNQQSDRVRPHIQEYVVPSRGNSTKRSLTRARPGACSPGGVGCDIKFNSYDRYLNRLKGRSVLKRGYISPEITKILTCGLPLPSNEAYPIYGSKYYKTNIISSCKCPGNALSTQCGSIPVPPPPCPPCKPCQKCVGQVVNLPKCKKYARVVNVLDSKYLMIEYLDMNGNNTENLDVVHKSDVIVKEFENVFEGAEEYFRNYNLVH